MLAQESDPRWSQNCLINKEVNAILVVDDESAVRAVVQSILLRAGYVVLSAKDGVEGLRVFKQHQTTIGLVLSDVMMPNMNGLELADQVLELDSRMPVIFMSGNMQANRGWGCVAKPFTANELVSNVRQALAIRIQRRVEVPRRERNNHVSELPSNSQPTVNPTRWCGHINKVSFRLLHQRGLVPIFDTTS
jgi:CheY-like chemotaxis protein